MSKIKKKMDVRFEALPYFAPGIYRETRVSISELLREGNKSDRRSAIGEVARMIETGCCLPPSHSFERRQLWVNRYFSP